MEQTKEVRNGTKASTEPQPTVPRQRVRAVVVREKQPVLSADDVIESSVRVRTSQIPQGWTSLDLGDKFRESPGGFIFVKVSCSKAYNLDTGKPLTVKSDHQMTKRVYQCWLTAI
jgi:hypothetical protein